LSSAFSERIVLFDRKILEKRRSRMAKKLIMFTLIVGGCFPEHNIGTSKVRWNMSPYGYLFIYDNCVFVNSAFVQYY
jgi:hypothetical protein